MPVAAEVGQKVFTYPLTMSGTVVHGLESPIQIVIDPLITAAATSLTKPRTQFCSEQQHGFCIAQRKECLLWIAAAVATYKAPCRWAQKRSVGRVVNLAEEREHCPAAQHKHPANFPLITYSVTHCVSDVGPIHCISEQLVNAQLQVRWKTRILIWKEISER